MIKVKDLSFSYKKTDSVLKEISFEIASGELLAILGSSGSGKTTLLNLLAGLIHPQQGVILNSSNTKPSAALVFQDYALFPNLSVLDNLKLISSDKEQIQGWIERLQLANFIGQKPSTLSGGQQQRVAVARAMLCNPELLLLDEPFSNLDTAHKTELRLNLKTLLKDKKQSTILVTHDLEDAFALADRLIVIDSGRIVQDDTPEKLYHNPSSEKVMALTGGYTSLITENGEKIFARPEHIKLDMEQNKCEVEILENQFSGSQFKVIYAINGTSGYFYSPERIINPSITIGIANNHVIRF
ncbi:ABC transporter ATP-binding protein [Luteibaculum oceani]|uniref:ABC transporter ATP-binding protein n=1 Tax=Luteibaculum oceani TaxID=1294296 RepID=UPI0014775092|nr:ABC transporter ATP-binding protein [Luteibaculum oceani]